MTWLICSMRNRSSSRRRSDRSSMTWRRAAPGAGEGSSPTTWWPAASSRVMTALPRNPLAPVTRTWVIASPSHDLGVAQPLDIGVAVVQPAQDLFRMFAGLRRHGYDFRRRTRKHDRLADDGDV